MALLRNRSRVGSALLVYRFGVAFWANTDGECARTGIQHQPLVLLLTHLLSILTVAKQTISTGPFTLRETDSSDTVNWNE